MTYSKLYKGLNAADLNICLKIKMHPAGNIKMSLIDKALNLKIFANPEIIKTLSFSRTAIKLIESINRDQKIKRFAT